MKFVLSSVVLAAFSAVSVSGEKGGFRGALLDGDFGSRLVEAPSLVKAPSGSRNRSNVVTKLHRKLEGPDVNAYYTTGSCVKKMGNPQVPFGDYCPVLEGGLTNPSGDGSSYDPLTLSNPNCCDFGFDRGIKVYEGGECQGNGGRVGQPAEAFPIVLDGPTMLSVSCPTELALEVTFLADFPAQDGKVMVFRKAGGSVFPAEFAECGDLTSSSTINVDNTAEGKATSHVDVCWNDGTPPEPENCDTDTNIDCSTKNTACIEHSCAPSDQNADNDGCVATPVLPDTTNDCCAVSNDCGAAPTCQTVSCDANTYQCQYENDDTGDTTCEVGACGVGKCSGGTCSMDVQPDDSKCHDSDEDDCKLPKCDSEEDYTCQETIPATEGSSCVFMYDLDGCCDANGSCLDSTSAQCSSCDCATPTLNFDQYDENDITVSCDTIPDAPTVTASSTSLGGSDCGQQSPEVTFDEDASGYDSCDGGTIIRKWSASNCGGSVTHSQTITIDQDETGPSITAPQDATYACTLDDVDDIMSAIGLPEITVDNCNGQGTSDFQDSVETAPSYCQTYTRTWTATDKCGNQNTDTQSVTVTKPSATIDANDQLTRVSCEADNADALIGDPDIFETCGAPVDYENGLWYEDTFNEGPAACRTGTRTWQYVDECGNDAVSDTQEIEFFDNAKPKLTDASKADFPENDPTVYKCLANVPGPSELSAMDNCASVDPATPTDTFEADPVCANKQTITRSVTFSDDCENESTFTQKITVNDDEKPYPTNSADVADKTYKCLSDVPDAAPLSVSDNCADDFAIDPNPDQQTVAPTVCDDQQTILRSWSFDDGCAENAVIEKQTITVHDDVSPTITAPHPKDVFCEVLAGGATTEGIDTGSATADDNCAAVPTVTSSDGQISSPSSCGSFTRTFTATDACGNEASAEQLVTFIDETPPTITLPANLELQCGALTVPSATGEATAGDNCADDVTVTYHDSYDFDSIPGVTITRSWTAEDECDNADTQVQTIAVYDKCDFTISEHFSGEDIDVNVQVENIVESGGVTGIEFTVTVTDNNLIADLRGVFFHLEGVTLDGAFEDEITSANTNNQVTEVKVADNGVIKMDTQKSVTMQGAGNKNVFDVGIAIGRQGLKGGSDDYQTTSFTIPGVTTDNLVGDVGIRVMSLGDRAGGDRGRSSKIVGPSSCCRPEQPVCGDGVVGLGEECDLGAANGQEGSECSLTCETTSTPPPTCQSPINDTTCCADPVPEECASDCMYAAIDCTPPPPPVPVCSCDGGANNFEGSDACPTPDRRFLN